MKINLLDILWHSKNYNKQGSQRLSKQYNYVLSQLVKEGSISKAERRSLKIVFKKKRFKLSKKFKG